VRTASPVVGLLLALAAAAFVLLHAPPAGAADGTATWALLERDPAAPKVKHPGARDRRRPPAVARVKAPVARRTAKPRKRTAKPVAAVPRTASAQAVGVNDPLWRDTWSHGKANVDTAWNLTAGAASTVIAVLDTGVDAGHPDLQGALVPGYDTVNEDADPTDDNGHGTMVAGVIAARANNGIGAAGTCWRCSLMPVKVIAGNGVGAAADIAEGIVWATDHGARVINMSFTLNAPSDVIAKAIERARAHGVVVVAAAGNAGSHDATYPAAYPGVVSVAGTDAADGRYAWSSYGSWVRLAAPGCTVTTATGATYGDFCGTSSAAAFVSGVAGLVRSLAGQLSPDAVAQALSTNAVRVGDFVGAGRVDAAATLTSLRAQAP